MLLPWLHLHTIITVLYRRRPLHHLNLAPGLARYGKEESTVQTVRVYRPWRGSYALGDSDEYRDSEENKIPVESSLEFHES